MDLIFKYEGSVYLIEIEIQTDGLYMASLNNMIIFHDFSDVSAALEATKEFIREYNPSF